jgi:hypothetical protein
MEANDRASEWEHRLSGKRFWSAKEAFLELVRDKGGFANHHAHFDKAFLANHENIVLSHAAMREKWLLFRELKEKYTEASGCGLNRWSQTYESGARGKAAVC